VASISSSPAAATTAILRLAYASAAGEPAAIVALIIKFALFMPVLQTQMRRTPQQQRSSVSAVEAI